MSTPIALEIFLGFGVPIAWGLWELHTLRREKQKDLEKARAEAAAHTAAQPALSPAAASGTATTSEPTAR
jgi:phage gp46-like protein